MKMFSALSYLVVSTIWLLSNLVYVDVQEVASLSAEHTIFSVSDDGPKMSLGER